MDISVVEGDTVPIQFLLADADGPVFSLGATIVLEVDTPLGVLTSSGTVDSPLGVGTITPSAAQTANAGVFKGRITVDGEDYPSLRDLKLSVLGHTRGH